MSVGKASCRDAPTLAGRRNRVRSAHLRDAGVPGFRNLRIGTNPRGGNPVNSSLTISKSFMSMVNGSKVRMETH